MPHQKSMSSSCRRAALGIVTAAAVSLLPSVLQAQLGLAVAIPIDNSQVVSLTNPSSTQEELPGLGPKFELIGAMVRDADPENPVGNSGASGGGVGGNETISATMTTTNFALAFRNLPPGIKIAALDNQLGFKYYFMAPRSCGGGSPRVTLLVDADGDGAFNQIPSGPDFAVHGHVSPLYAGCPTNKWIYENLTDDLPRWEVTPAGPGNLFGYNPWETVENGITAAFPAHKILAGFLVDDSCSFFQAACGKAYYDLLTIENRTLEIWQDTVKN
jgi:hypothetical protein